LTWTHPYPTYVSVKSTGPRVFTNWNLSDFYFDSCQDLTLTRATGYVIGRIVWVIFVRIAVLFPWVFTGIAAAARGEGVGTVTIFADADVPVGINRYIIASVPTWGRGGGIRGAYGRQISRVSGGLILVFWKWASCLSTLTRT
jgi:hypothetical protein